MAYSRHRRDELEVPRFPQLDPVEGSQFFRYVHRYLRRTGKLAAIRYEGDSVYSDPFPVTRHIRRDPQARRQRNVRAQGAQWPAEDELYAWIRGRLPLGTPMNQYKGTLIRERHRCGGER